MYWNWKYNEAHKSEVDSPPPSPRVRGATFHTVFLISGLMSPECSLGYLTQTLFTGKAFGETSSVDSSTNFKIVLKSGILT